MPVKVFLHGLHSAGHNSGNKWYRQGQSIVGHIDAFIDSRSTEECRIFPDIQQCSCQLLQTDVVVSNISEAES